MKREDKCISLELAKEIDKYHKKLGIVAPDSECSWALYPDDKYYIREGTSVGHKYWLATHQEKYKYYTEDLIHSPAYDTSELGEMLPYSIGDKTWLQCTFSKTLTGYGRWKSISYAKWEKHEGAGQLLIKKVHEIGGIRYEHPDKGMPEAEARGKMYLWLLKEGYIKGVDNGE